MSDELAQAFGPVNISKTFYHLVNTSHFKTKNNIKRNRFEVGNVAAMYIQAILHLRVFVMSPACVCDVRRNWKDEGAFIKAQFIVNTGYANTTMPWCIKCVGIHSQHEIRKHNNAMMCQVCSENFPEAPTHVMMRESIEQPALHVPVLTCVSLWPKRRLRACVDYESTLNINHSLVISVSSHILFCCVNSKCVSYQSQFIHK